MRKRRKTVAKTCLHTEIYINFDSFSRSFQALLSWSKGCKQVLRISLHTIQMLSFTPMISMGS